MKLKSLTRLLVVVFTVGLVSVAPAARIFDSSHRVGPLGVAAQSCPSGPCPTSTCDISCQNPPTPCVGCVTVSPCTMANTGWAVQVLTDSQTCPPTGSLAFQTGPACAPANLGSAEFIVGPDGNSDVRLRNSNFNGTKLSDLTALSYCTYVQFKQPGSVVAPYLALTVDLNSNGIFDGFGVDDVIFFEPAYQNVNYSTTCDGSPNPGQNGGVVATCSWQCWDAMIGVWWSGADFIGAGGNIPCFTTLSSYLNRPDHGNAKILNPDDCKGGVQLRAGEGAGPWDCFVGNVDKFTIAVGGTTPSSVTYDFEPADCPIPPCGISPATTITACKFYDKNADGIKDPSDPPIDNWPITINPLGSAIPQQATQPTSGGCVSWGNLNTALNPYAVSEGTPNQANWVHSTPSSVSVTVVFGQTSTVNFGNYCRVASGGLTLGFWSNKNGQAILRANDPAWRKLLNGCCLRNANGTLFTIPTVGSFANAYSVFRTWLLGANATNMAYMLSAQLAAMKLNVAFGSVNGSAFDLCSHKTIADLIISANASLCTDGSTPAGDPNRTTQEALKNCLDALNNGGLVVSPTPCPATFSQVSAQAFGVASTSSFAGDTIKYQGRFMTP